MGKRTKRKQTKQPVVEQFTGTPEEHVQVLQDQIILLNKTIKRLKQRDAQLVDMISDFNQRMEDLEEEHDQQMDDLQDKHERELDKMESRHEQEREELEFHHERNVNKLEKGFGDLFSDNDDYESNNDE